MPKYDFTPIYELYPSIISQMPPTFTSHQFILELARQYQDLYVEALYAYRSSQHADRPSPFQAVHRRLAQGLSSFPVLAEKVRNDKPSVDIFGQKELCTEWRKI